MKMTSIAAADYHIPHIDRRTDGETMYFIETKADYDALPAALRPAKPLPDGVEPVPESVSMRQIRLALLAAGKLTSANAAIAATINAKEKADEIEWNYSPTMERHHPAMLSLAAKLSLTEAQLDT